MLDQNTDRMWYVIGAVLIGAAIIFGMNTLMPEAFASVGTMMGDTLSDIELYMDRQSNENGLISEDRLVHIRTYTELDGFYTYKGGDLTITKNHSVPEWGTNRAVNVTITGGTDITKIWYPLVLVKDQVVGRRYVYTVPVKNVGSDTISITSNKSPHIIIKPGETLYYQPVMTGGTKANIQIQFEVVDDLDDVVDVMLGELVLSYIKEGD